MDTLGLDTIAGAKLLQLRFGPAGAFQPDQAVMHGSRRARFICVKQGAAIIQHWGDSHAVAVPLESLSIPPRKPPYPLRPAPAETDARQAVAVPDRPRLVVRAEVGEPPRHRRQRRPVLRP
jgi:hypothetical protein